MTYKALTLFRKVATLFVQPAAEWTDPLNSELRESSVFTTGIACSSCDVASELA